MLDKPRRRLPPAPGRYAWAGDYRQQTMRDQAGIVLAIVTERRRGRWVWVIIRGSAGGMQGTADNIVEARATAVFVYCRALWAGLTFNLHQPRIDRWQNQISMSSPVAARTPS